MKLLKSRPLSPHVQVYKFNLPMFTSIFGRFCGGAAFVSIFLMSWGIIIDTFFINQFLITFLDFTILSQNVALFLASMFVMWFIIFAMFFYFATMTRHLLWNWGILIDLKYANFLSILTLAFGFVCSSCVLLLIIANLSRFKLLVSIF